MSKPKHLAVMSLWTAPVGWRANGLDVSALLSTAHLRQLVNAGHFTGLVLHTDAAGKAWAEGLGLPFDEVYETLADEGVLPGSMRAIWAAGKLATYAVQKEAFLHFDMDVFLKRALPEHVLRARFAFERCEPFAACTCGRDKRIQGDFLEWEMPEAWKRAMEGCLQLAYGCGLAGGLDALTLAAAGAESLAVARANAGKVKHGGQASVFVEQWGMARGLDAWEVATLLPAKPCDVDAAGLNYSHSGPHKAEVGRQRLVYAALKRRFPGLAERLQGVFIPESEAVRVPELASRAG